jgi:drug/metabolite transporter (DMT)-like permease
MMVATGFYLVYKGFLKKTFLDMKGNFRFVITMSLLDVVAWVAYSFSMTLAPIAIATALAESYIIIAVLLGIFINKEKLLPHQRVGLVGALSVAIVLAFISS